MLFSCVCWCQDLQLTFHHLDQEDGLPPAENYFFSQNSQGFIWIGTDGGLCRFDGQVLLNYAHQPADSNSISENLVTSPCFEDEGGNLWFTTSKSVQCLHVKSGKFEAWRLPGSRQIGYRAFDLVSGALWLGIGNGNSGSFYHFDIEKKTFRWVSPMEGNRCIRWAGKGNSAPYLIETQLPNRAGFVWQSAAGGKAAHFDLVKTRDGRKRTYPSPTNAALPDGDSLVWFGVYNGLGVFHQKNQAHWVEEERLPNLPIDLGWVYGIVPLDDQSLLVSCSSGLAVFDRKTRRFTKLLEHSPNDPYGLLKATYEELFKDASGNIWMERNGQGVSFASLQKHKFFSPPELTRASFSALYEDRRGNIWCSTKDNGTYVLDKEESLFQHHSKLDIQEERDRAFDLLEMAAFMDDQSGNFWGTSENYFCFWDEKKGVFSYRNAYFQGVPSSAADRINLVYSLRNGDILAAKGKDIFKLLTSPEKVSLDPWHDLSALQLQIITALFQDKKGRVYLADQTERLLVFIETAGGVQRIAELTNTGICNGFLEMGDSLVYATTSKGLLKIETRDWRYRLLDEKADGIPNETFYKVLVDKKDLLWLSGTNGLVRYDPLKKQFHRFGTADGLASKGASPNAFIMSSSGEFWLGGKNGLNVFKPEDVQLMTNSPPVRITQILVNDTLFSEKNKGETTSLDLDYRRNTLSFRFAALDFSDPGSNEFYYRLQGFEDDWVYNGTQGFVRYANLPPGDFVLEVKATNSDGILGENTHRLAIHIRPPFWRTWWFYLLCALFVSGLIWGWMQYRLQQAVKMERLRVKISSDLHDEVGTLLSGLAMQTEVLELTARTEDKSKLHRIAELSRSAMLSMRDTVWAIDARKDKFENLLDRMREHAEETLTSRNFRFDMAVEGLDLKKSIPVDVRQNLYLIYKEAITNIAKHSNGDAVEVRLARVGDAFEMRIHDNGKVEEKAYKTTGLGLSNMQLRTERLDGVLTVDTKSGFRIRLYMKNNF